MHSFLSRANAVFAFTLSVLASCAFGAFLTTFFLDFSAPSEVVVQKALVKNLPDYTANREQRDLGFLNYDLRVDVSPLFNWNVKQLFLYLTAEYQTPKNPKNQVVIWDKILLRHESPVVDVKAQTPKYYFWDDGTGLKGHQNVSLTLHWNVVPNAGHLPLVSSSSSHSFSFPNEYTVGKIK